MYKGEDLPRVPPDPEVHPRHGPLWPGLGLAVGTCWLLRGLELADLLREQASVHTGRRTASLDLAATKGDPQGRGCVRELPCLCPTAVPGPCPYCVLRKALELGSALGLDGKDPLFPDAKGRAPTRRRVIKAMNEYLRSRRLSEHSMRRAGAQMLARRGVPPWIIQFLGRWAGTTLMIYIQEALRQQMTAGLGGAVTGCTEAGALTWDTLRTEIRAIVQAALPSAPAAGDAAEADGPSTSERAESAAIEVAGLLEQKDAAPEGTPDLMPRMKVRGVRGRREIGYTHDVIVMDATVPRELWLTRCGWAFGNSEHAAYFEREATCPKCLAFRATGGGALSRRAKARKTQELSDEAEERH